VRVRVRSELKDNVKSGRDDATGFSLHGVRLTTAAHKGGLRSRLAGPQLAIHTFTISEEHAPGMHWYHVGGDLGFVGAFYVLPKDEFPTAAATAPAATAPASSTASEYFSRLLLLQSHDHEESLSSSSSSSSSYLVNGELEPEALSLLLGEGQQLDLAHGSGADLLEIVVAGQAGCEMQLLALDGIDLEEPREVESVRLVPRQRARVMVTCQEEGEATLLARVRGDGVGVQQEETEEKKEEGTQRLLALSVVKGMGKKSKGSKQFSGSRTAAGGINGYLRDLAMAPQEGEAGLLLSSCAISLFPCPSKTFCPAGREICPLSTPTPEQDKKEGEGEDEWQKRLLSMPSRTQHSMLRELFVTLTDAVPSACVRLSPAQPFQVLEFTPADKHAKINPYLRKWGKYGEWRDVLPPLEGTFRLRYLAQEEVAQEDPCVEYDGFNVLEEGEEDEGGREGGGGHRRRVMWSFPGHKKVGAETTTTVVVETKEAYLLVQAMIGEEKQDPEWVEESIKELIREYLVVEKEDEPAADDDTMMPIETMPTTLDNKQQQQQRGNRRVYDNDALAQKVRHRALTALSSSPNATPIQMPRRYLPGSSACNNTSLVWPTAFTLHLKNSSSIYPVVSKLHGLLAEGGSENLPQLCSVNVTLLSSGTAAASTAAAAAAASEEGEHGLLKQKVPSRVIVLLAFAGGACILLIGLLAYRQLLAPVGPPRSSRRSSVHHDPTTIETQITELDDSTSLGIKGSHHLRHNSRSRTNSLIGMNPALFPPSRLSSSSNGSLSATAAATADSAAPGLGGSLTNVTSQQQQQQQQHYRSASSLPADLGSLGHGRSSSMPHHSGFGFFFPRRQSTESIHLSYSGALGGSGGGARAGATAAGAGAGGGGGGEGENK